MSSGMTTRKELVFDGSISDLTIKWLADSLWILPSENDELRIVQKTTDKFPESKLFLAEKNHKELLIVDGRKQTFNIGFNVNHTILEAYLPRKRWNSLTITITGGQVSVKDLNADYCKCHITSGRANLSGQISELDLKLTGSNVTGDCLDVRELRLQSVSSKSEFSGMFNSIETRLIGNRAAITSDIIPERIHSVSTAAQVMVSIPDNDGFQINVKKRSGTIKSDFPLISDGKRLIYSSGKREYRAEVQGGQFTLCKVLTR
ncbi:hypothetical protein D3C81_1072770 [compost metagenome]